MSSSATSEKQKGGAEKRRKNNKILLLNSSDKCLKINEMFLKSKCANNISLTSTNKVSENVLFGNIKETSKTLDLLEPLSVGSSQNETLKTIPELEVNSSCLSKHVSTAVEDILLCKVDDDMYNFIIILF